MSNTKNSPFDFGNMMPGFDFLKQMASKSPASNPFMPNAGSWITPTLSVEELDKRINELKTVKMWLENNARLIDATVQAMQVQKMTLATLKTMNVNLADISKSFTGGGTSAGSRSSAKSSTSRNKTEFDLGQKPQAASKTAAPKSAATKSAAAAEPEGNALAMQNAMQFWNGLTQQFGQITEQVMQDSQAAAAKLANTSKTATTRSTTARSKTTAAKKAPATKTAARKTSRR